MMAAYVHAEMRLLRERLDTKVAVIAYLLVHALLVSGNARTTRKQQAADIAGVLLRRMRTAAADSRQILKCRIRSYVCQTDNS